MKKQRRKKYAPLRSFTWSDNLVKSPGQELVENTVQEWYDVKHPTASQDEVSFVNSLEIEKCPFVVPMILLRMDIRKMEYKDTCVKNVKQDLLP